MDTASLSLSSSMLGHYCAWVLGVLAARRFDRFGIQVGLSGLQGLLWIGLSALFYLRARRGGLQHVRRSRGGESDGTHERADGEPGIEI